MSFQRNQSVQYPTRNQSNSGFIYRFYFFGNGGQGRMQSHKTSQQMHEQKLEDLNSQIKTKASKSLQKFSTQSQEDKLVRFIVTDMPSHTSNGILITDTSGLKEALCHQAGIGFTRVKCFDYIHDSKFMEFVCYQSDLQRIKKAFETLKQVEVKTRFCLACLFKYEQQRFKI